MANVSPCQFTNCRARSTARNSLPSRSVLDLWAHARAPHSAPRLEPLISSRRTVWSQIAVAVGASAAIVAATRFARPFYAARAPIVAQLEAHPYVDSMSLRAPWLHAPPSVSLKSPQFLLDRDLFTMDLLRTGKVGLIRARTLADVAVREAYTRRVPPALVLGVMLTENDELKTAARSRVGAVGLMQVNPRPWRGALADKLGNDVHADSTNLKYGIYILGWLAKKAAAVVDDHDTAWRKALLHYNGCARGTNTRDCHAYPDVVRRQVVLAARSTCRGADFEHCVALPMWLAHRETDSTLWNVTAR